METKTIITTVTYQQYRQYQSDQMGNGDIPSLYAGNSLLIVECPEDYDKEKITAEDIVHDGSIRLVGAVFG